MVNRPETANLPGPNEHCWCGSGKKYKRCHLNADKDAPSAPAQAARRVKPGRVGPRRAVPASIPRPEYAETGRLSEKAIDEVLAGERLARMRRSCRAAAEVLQAIGKLVRPGITTDEIDAVCHEEYLKRGGYPSTLNYHGYPKSLCTSVNEVICHGIPDDRKLLDGDIVNLDVTIFLEGMHGDCSATFLVGEVDPGSRQLVRVTHECLLRGIEAVKPGRPISDIGKAIEAHATKFGYGVVRAYCGHGVSERFHNSLQIPHYFEPSATRKMLPGMTFTIEPMINEGTWDHRTWDDGWTAVTADLKRSAQFEHTVLVTDSGAEILTLAAGQEP